MKRELQTLIEATADAARAWSSASVNLAQSPNDGFRPAFIAHRLACAITELEELLAVHTTLWTDDRVWREKQVGSVVDRLYSRQALVQSGSEVGEEERPDPALARSKEVGDLFKFFCQVRRHIQYLNGAPDSKSLSQDVRLGLAIEHSLVSIGSLDRQSKEYLQGKLAAFIRNSFLLSDVRLPHGGSLGERYLPLFRAIRLLRGETIMNIDQIRKILVEAEIDPETRSRVEQLIAALGEWLSEADIIDVRDRITSGGHLPPGINNRGDIVVIPGDSPGHCAPIVLAVAHGSRGRFGLAFIMREIRAHLIQCFETAEVVILLTDVWDPNGGLMKESLLDFQAYAWRTKHRKILIPVVCWKQQINPLQWP